MGSAYSIHGLDPAGGCDLVPKAGVARPHPTAVDNPNQALLGAGRVVMACPNPNPATQMEESMTQALICCRAWDLGI